MSDTYSVRDIVRSPLHSARTWVAGLGAAMPGESPSIRRAIDTVRNAPRPIGYQAQEDYPFRADDVNWRVHPQGVATDGQYWYVTHAGPNWIGFSEIWADLHRDLPQIELQVASPWNHYGDPDVYNGRVYIPLEENQPPAVLSVDAGELRELGSAAPGRFQFLDGTNAAWVAINRRNGHMYTAPEYTWVNRINEYSFIDDPSGLHLTLLRQIPLTNLANDRGLYRVQGGAFGPDGSLYLVSFDGNEDMGGIHVFNEDGARIHHISVDYTHSEIHEYVQLGDTLEGITFADMDSGQSPGISGHVHLVMFKLVELGKDRLYFKHYRAIY